MSTYSFLLNKIVIYSFNKIDMYLSCYLNRSILDEMGERISELEQSINDLRAEMGAEGTPPPATAKKPDDDSA